MSGTPHAMVDFYCGTGTDHRGHRFERLLRTDDLQLERTHDYVQWRFPTVTASQFNPEAPRLRS